MGWMGVPFDRSIVLRVPVRIDAEREPQQAPKVRTCSLHVQVTDEDGGMVDRAFVLIHSDTGVKLSQQLVLDQTGQTKSPCARNSTTCLFRRRDSLP